MVTTSTEILTQCEPEIVGMPIKRTVRKGNPKTQQVLVGWDKQRSWTFVGLSLCFVVWACIYFPLIMQ